MHRNSYSHNVENCRLLFFFASQLSRVGQKALLDTSFAVLVTQANTVDVHLTIDVDLVTLADVLDITDLLGGSWLSTDSLVAISVHLLHVIRVDTVLDVSGEDLLILLLILLFKRIHVLTNVASEDTLLVEISIVLALVALTLRPLVAREALLAVRNVQATVSGTLEDTEDLGSCGSWLEANIQNSLEWACSFGFLLDEFIHFVIHLTVDLGGTLEFVGEANLLENTAGEQQASAIRGRVVLQADLDAVLGKFGGISVHDDTVTSDGGVGDLCDATLVGETSD